MVMPAPGRCACRAEGTPLKKRRAVQPRTPFWFLLTCPMSYRRVVSRQMPAAAIVSSHPRSGAMPSRAAWCRVGGLYAAEPGPSSVFSRRKNFEGPQHDPGDHHAQIRPHRHCPYRGEDRQQRDQRLHRVRAQCPSARRPPKRLTTGKHLDRKTTLSLPLLCAPLRDAQIIVYACVGCGAFA